MGSMMKADSERRELVRERRQARMERKQQRRTGARAQALTDQRDRHRRCQRSSGRPQQRGRRGA